MTKWIYLWMALLLAGCDGNVADLTPGDDDTTGDDDAGDDDLGDDDTDDDDDSTPPPSSNWSWYAENTVDDADASLVGEQADSFAGMYLRVPGDLNGDGIDDLTVGDVDYVETGNSNGKLYFVFGRESGWQMHEPLEPYPSIIGEYESHCIGQVHSIGDLDGDGLADVVLDTGGISGGQPGQQYVMFGKTSGWQANLHCPTDVDASVYNTNADGSSDIGTSGYLGDYDGDGLDDWLTSGPVIYRGEAHMISGGDVTSMDMPLPESARGWVYGDTQSLSFGSFPDVNGDGLAEIKATQGSSGRRAFLLFGRETGHPHGEAMHDVADVSFVSPSFQPGDSDTIEGLNPIGDINGDGYGDLSLDFYGEDPNDPLTGMYLYFGRESWNDEYDVYDEADVAITGFNTTVALNVGDINDDGIDDLVIQAPETEASEEASDIYIYFGSTGPWPARLGLDDADVHIAPQQYLDELRVYQNWHQQRGDIDGDGITDLLLVAPYSDWNGVVSAGLVVVFCGRTSWPAEMTSADADVTFVGSAVGQDMGLGYRTLVGDINGDGYDDLVAASFYHPIGTEEGETFIFFGQPR